MECDCCLRHRDRFWVYRHRGFGYHAACGNFVFDAGWWAFCVFCHALFLECDYDALAARVCVLNPLLDHADTEGCYRVLGQVVYEEPVAWQEGEDSSTKRFPIPTEEEIAR
jgi:hypothetical protein